MIEAVIFDWAGTTVDYGCMAPVEAFRRSFADYQINVLDEEIREPMGMLKVDHIKAMLAMPRIYDAFTSVYGRAYCDQDIDEIYHRFQGHLMSTIAQYTKVKPYVLEAVRELRLMGLKIGSTTGYTDAMMEPVLEGAIQQGYVPDFWTSPDGVHGIGRPKPFMIFKNMEALGVDDVRNVVKVGDTISDIQEGKHAGVYTIGVLEGSSLAGMSEEAYLALRDEEQAGMLNRAKQSYTQAGADAVILNMKELPQLIKQLNKRQ